ncbi:MAG: Wzz/FepE/Etk N-terminal domain-containing protein [Eubacterium sp.]|nr:Wzz/FepE/Etk N-terminal domain-containing protein [Eubacterium sp.]
MNNNQLDLKELLQLFKQYIKSMTIIVLIALVLTGVYTFVICDKVYQSDSTVMVGLSSDYSGNENTDNTAGSQKFTSQDIEYWVSTYSTAIKSVNVVDPLSEQLGYKVTADQISLTQLNDTQFLKLSVTAESPEKAQIINETVAPIFKEYISSLYKIDNLAVVEPASFSNKAVSPSIPKNMLIGLVGGVVLAILYVLVRDIYDTRIRSVDDIKAITGLPVLAVIPLSESLNDGEDSKKKRKREEA